MKNISVTRGNSKLPKSTLNFSLPPILSCPNSTKQCISHCYAKKAFKQYPNVRTAWTNNFKCSLFDGFYDTLKGKINSFKKWETFRISVSGDFYNQRYLDIWFKVAKLFPNKIFYTYTKSHHLDFKNKPNNMIIFLSDDNGKLKKEYKKFDGVARVVKKGYKLKKTEFLCKGSCRECNYCFTKSTKFKKVIFEVH